MTSKILLFVTSMLAFSANASMIDLEVRGLQSANFNNSDYEQSWNNHTSSITQTSLSEFTGIKSGNNSFSHLSIEFDISSIDFQFGLDAGYGAEINLDSNLLERDTTDIWWSLNWGHSDVLSVNLNSLSNGSHSLDLYWAEGCCNGVSSGRFSTDGGNTYQALSVANLDVAAVPEPSVIALFGFGMLGLGLMRRKIRK